MLRDAVKVLAFSPLNVNAPLSVISPVPAPVPAVTPSEKAAPLTVPKVMPGVLIKVLAALSVMGPDTVTALTDELVNAPPEETPVPATVAPFNKV